MERGKIAIDGYGNIKIQTKYTSDIWMNEPELVDFFNIIAPTFRAAVRAIYKKGILKSGEVEKRVKRKDGFYENLYSVEMIFALAFQLDTYVASQLRNFLIYRAMNTSAKNFFCCINQIGVNVKCYNVNCNESR